MWNVGTSGLDAKGEIQVDGPTRMSVPMRGGGTDGLVVATKPVTRVERGSPPIWPRGLVNPQWEELMSEAKPYVIPKQLVWEAYQRVKANRGSAGVDGESLATFEAGPEEQSL